MVKGGSVDSRPKRRRKLARNGVFLGIKTAEGSGVSAKGVVGGKGEAGDSQIVFGNDNLALDFGEMGGGVGNFSREAKGGKENIFDLGRGKKFGGSFLGKVG